jgi:predicted NodU family carbamoyl transferase
MAAELAAMLFGANFSSPFMSFAPRLSVSESAQVLPLRRWFAETRDGDSAMRAWVSDVTHLDSSARVQTVERQDDEWLWQLLSELGPALPPCILNTSFNVKGKPIINSICSILGLLGSEADLDYVAFVGPPVVPDRLFRKLS